MRDGYNYKRGKGLGIILVGADSHGYWEPEDNARDRRGLVEFLE